MWLDINNNTRETERGWRGVVHLISIGVGTLHMYGYGAYRASSCLTGLYTDVPTRLLSFFLFCTLCFPCAIVERVRVSIDSPDLLRRCIISMDPYVCCAIGVSIVGPNA